jgi:hypothetical protein
MISRLNPLHILIGRGAGTTCARIQALRFRNLLENARAVYDCLRDGEEKLGGEHIFDRHFVVSLVDAVLESLGKAVFDACILSPSSAELLCSLYDRQKHASRGLLLEDAAARSETESSVLRPELREYPEFRLLAGAVAWLKGSGGTNGGDALGLLRTAIEHAAHGLQSAREFRVPHRTIRLAAGGALNLLRIVSHGGGLRASPGPELALRDLRSKPLGLMLIGGDCRPAGDAESGKAELREWYALAGEEKLDLWTGRGAGDLRLHASLCGQAGADFIFLFAGASIDPGEFVPEGFRMERGELGTACWSLGGTGGDLENDLMRLGRWLFRTASV